MSSGYVFLNIHALSQCEDTSTCKEVYGDIEKGNISSGYDSLNIHTNLKHNFLESLINDNDSNDTDINETFYNLDVSIGIGLLNIHTISQDN